LTLRSPSVKLRRKSAILGRAAAPLLSADVAGIAEGNIAWKYRWQSVDATASPCENSMKQAVFRQWGGYPAKQLRQNLYESRPGERYLPDLAG
jgi:hypothetical protein